MSAFGTFKFGTGVKFGSGLLEPDCLAIARSIMLRFHSAQVVNKETEASSQFRVILALARAICTMKDEAIATHNDNFLPACRPEHMDAVWGSMLGVPYDSTKTVAENIEFYQRLITIYLNGSDFDGLTYPGTHAVNVITAIYLFSLLTGVRLYENWRDYMIMFGGIEESFEIGAPDPDSQSFLGGSALLGPGGNPGRVAQVRAGVQVIIPLDNYAGANTDPIVTGAMLMKPAMADFVLVYELTDLFAGGVDPDVTEIAFGRGTQDLSPLPSALAFEVYRTPVFQCYVDDNWLPVPYATTRKRYFAIMDREYVFGLVPITEAALLDSAGTIKIYRTFSAINKDDDTDVCMGWNVDFT